MQNKLLLIYICLALFYASDAHSQGFDWRVSPREPFATPKLFIGVTAGGGYGYHYGNIDFYEAQVSCAKFSSGSAYDYNSGFKVEYWAKPKLALNLIISRSAFSSRFEEQNAPIPIRDSKPLITKNILNIDADYLNFTFGAKQRFAGYYFVETQLSTSFLLSDKQSQSEEVVSPDSYYFQTSPPSKTRDISESSISDFSKFNLSANLNFGYDYSIGIFKYISPKIGVSFPISSYLKSSSYKSLSLNLTIDINFGILENKFGN